MVSEFVLHIHANLWSRNKNGAHNPSCTHSKPHTKLNNENNQQDALYRLIYYSKLAVHVSGRSVAPISRSTWLYLQYLVVFTQVAAGWQPAATWVNATRYCKYNQVLLMMGENIAPKHVEPSWNNKLIYIVNLVGYFHSCITMHGFMNVKFTKLNVTYWHCVDERVIFCRRIPVILRVRAFTDVKPSYIVGERVWDSPSRTPWSYQLAEFSLVSRSVTEICLWTTTVYYGINPLNPKLNPICYLLALLGAHHFLHVSKIRVKLLTFRLLMSYIWSTHSWCF